MKSLINSAKNILIILSNDFNFDTAASALGFAHLLSQGRKVRIGLATSIPSEFSELLDFSSYKLINKLKKREVVLSLNRRKGGVKAVRWRELDGKIQFIITPAEDDFEFDDVDLETVGDETDLVVMLGCESLKSAGGIYESNPSFFKNSKILNIDINLKNENYGTVNKIGKNGSLAGWILQLADQSALKVNKEAIEALLKGVFWGSEGFRSIGDLKNAFKKFISMGGEITDTLTKMFNTLTVAQVRYIGKVIENMQINKRGVLRSKVRFNEIQGIKLDRVIYPELNLISRVRDFKAAVILSEYKKDRVVCRLYSHVPEVNLLHLFSDLAPVGNSQRVVFNLVGNIDGIEKRLMEKIYTAVNKDEDEPEFQRSQPSKVKKKEVQEKDDSQSKREPLKKASKLPAARDLSVSNSHISYPRSTQNLTQPQGAPGIIPPPPIQPLPPMQQY